MTTIYANIPYVFLSDEFWGDVREQVRLAQWSDTMMAEFLGLKESTVQQIRANSNLNGWLPTVRTLLHICNMLDLSPAQYFVLAE